MAYLDQYNNSLNTTFKARVRLALINHVLTVFQEPTTTTNHAAHVATGKQILQALDNWVDLSCQVLAVQGLTKDSTDAQIDTAIQGFTDPISLVFGV